MSMTLMQRLRLWWRGSRRRREEFGKTVQWGTGASPVVAPAAQGQARAPVLHEIDRDGLLSAYLDQSGRTLYYLDFETGEVVECQQERSDLARIPTQDEAADREAFIATHGLTVTTSFREAIARDRATERAWYNFKTQRANDAIDAWLKRVRDSG